MTDTTTNPKPETPNADHFPSLGRFALILAALLAFTFWRVLFGGEAFFYRDYGFLGYPFAHFHRECFWSGDFFPLWNPYVNCGAPFLAQWNTLCLYPGALIYLLLPLPWSLGFFCVAHLFLGGMGMRALAERWTGSRFGAAVAGVAFVFSGLVLGCVIYPNYLVALGWMPWVALATRRAWQEGGRNIVLAALAGAMQMLTGAPEIILLTWGFLAALLVVDWIQGPKSKVQSRSAQASSGGQGDSSLTPAPSRREREGTSTRAGASEALLASPAVEDPAPKSETASLNPSQPTSPPRPAGEGRGEGERAPAPAASFSAQAPLTPPITNHFSLLTRFAAVIALITGLCAAQLLPFFQLLSLSQRSGDAVSTFWSLPGWGWVNLFFPLFMNFQTEQGVFVMIGQSFFPSVYLGIVPLTLALLAVWRIGLRRVGCPPFRVSEGTDTLKRGHQTEGVWEVRLLAGATLLAVLLAMGDNFVLWRWLREVLPLGIMRFPIKALLLAAFTVPLLAAWGMAMLGNNQRPPSCFERKELENLANVVTFGVLGHQLVSTLGLDPRHSEGASFVAAVNAGSRFIVLLRCALWFALRGGGKRPTGSSFLLIVLLLWSDGVLHQPAFNPTIPAAAFEPGLAAAYHASKGELTPVPKLGESRIMIGPRAERLLHYRMVPKFYDDFIGQRLAFWGNLNLLDGLPKVNGASTLVTREWNEVEYFLYGTTNPAPANLMDFLGVTHTTKPGELMQWERRDTAMPLVSLPAEVEGVYGSLTPPAWLRPEWNPRAKAFLNPEIPANTFVTWAKPQSFSSGSVRVVQFSATRLELESEAMEQRYLVVAQNHHPSWQVTVNGQPAPVLRANHAFQAIPIPAGKSTIRLDYVDWPFRIGAGISLLTLLGCLVFLRRHTPPA